MREGEELVGTILLSLKVAMWRIPKSKPSPVLISVEFGLNLPVKLRPFKAFGGSLVVPIYLSIKSIDDPFSPTKDKYLATGRVDENGILQDVDGLEEKGLLAEQLGLGFVGPKINEESGGLTYKSGSEQNYVFFEKWKKELGTDISLNL